MRSSSRIYYFADGNLRRGPFSLDEMREFPLRADTWVWRSGLPAWAELADVPELWAVFAERLVAPPPAAQQFAVPAGLPAEPMSEAWNLSPLAFAAIALALAAFPAWMLPWSIFFVTPLALTATGLGLIAYRRSRQENTSTFGPLVGAGMGGVNLAIVLALVGMIVFVALTTKPRRDGDVESASPTTTTAPAEPG